MASRPIWRSQTSSKRSRAATVHVIVGKDGDALAVFHRQQGSARRQFSMSRRLRGSGSKSRRAGGEEGLGLHGLNAAPRKHLAHRHGQFVSAGAAPRTRARRPRQGRPSGGRVREASTPRNAGGCGPWGYPPLVYVVRSNFLDAQGHGITRRQQRLSANDVKRVVDVGAGGFVRHDQDLCGVFHPYGRTGACGRWRRLLRPRQQQLWPRHPVCPRASCAGSKPLARWLRAGVAALQCLGGLAEDWPAVAACDIADVRHHGAGCWARARACAAQDDLADGIAFKYDHIGAALKLAQRRGRPAQGRAACAVQGRGLSSGPRPAV